MSSIPLDKPLNRSPDPASVTRPGSTKNGPNDSFGGHLQRLAAPPSNPTNSSSAADDAPRAQPAAPSTDSCESEKKPPDAPAENQQPTDSATTSLPNAPTPVVVDPTATPPDPTHNPDGDKPQATAKQNVKPTPTGKHGPATASKAALANKTPSVQPQTDQPDATLAIDNLAPGAIPSETSASGDPQKPASPEAQQQVAPTPPQEVVSDQPQPAVADPQTQAVSNSQQEIALETQPPALPDSKTVAAAAKPEKSALAEDQEPPAVEPEPPRVSTKERVSTREAKSAREPTGGAKKGEGNRGQYDTTDPTFQPASALAAATSATDPGSATAAHVEGNSILTPAAGAESSRPGTGAQSPTPFQSATAFGSRDSLGAPARTTAASAGTSKINDVDRVRFIQRVSRAMQTAGEGDGLLRLRLSPPELGPVRLEVSIKDGVMSARLEAETPAAQAALLDNYRELQHRLAEQDIQLEHFEVNLSDRSGADGSPNQSFDQAGAQRDFRSPTPRSKAQGATNSSEPATAVPASRVIGSDQLNVVI